MAMTIDIIELYHAALERKCSMKVVDYKYTKNVDLYFIQITENNGVTYTVTLSPDHNWGQIW